MAINEIILRLERFGISATRELGDGKWTHSAEYIAYRSGGVKNLIDLLKRNIDHGSERARIQLALIKGDPSILINEIEGAENGAEQ